MDPIFAVLSEQFTEGEFLQVDSEECRVQQLFFFHLCHAFVQLFIIVTVQLLVSLSLSLSLSLSQQTTNSFIVLHETYITREGGGILQLHAKMLSNHIVHK